jgi:hypothetical protein
VFRHVEAIESWSGPVGAVDGGLVYVVGVDHSTESLEITGRVEGWAP